MWNMEGAICGSDLFDLIQWERGQRISKKQKNEREGKRNRDLVCLISLLWID